MCRIFFYLYYPIKQKKTKEFFVCIFSTFCNLLLNIKKKKNWRLLLDDEVFKNQSQFKNLWASIFITFYTAFKLQTVCIKINNFIKFIYLKLSIIYKL